jgi:hypothetical protein
MSWRFTALKFGLVWTPMAVAFHDLVLGVVPVTGDSYGLKDEQRFGDNKSYILVNKWRGSKMRRGEIEKDDLVVLTDPTDPGKRIIRKVGGLADKWVRVDDGVDAYHVYVRKGYCWLNGRDTKRKKKQEGEQYLEQQEDAQVDSIRGKHDSMTFGPISMGLILGSPVLVVGPMRRFGALLRTPNLSEQQSSE